jgi:acyl carrier protein
MRQAVPQLRNYLQEKLPDYMVPSVIMILERLPLTANGKVDRKALPLPELSRMGLAQRYVEARNEAEAKLAGIWCEVLGMEQVGIYDNFFELGGHSLLAVQVVSRVQTIFGIELPLANVFESPNIASMAEIIEWGVTKKQRPVSVTDKHERMIL